MIVHECTQGSKEWMRLRSGIPTASEFSRILTPKGKPSAQAKGYRRELLAEMLMGRPLEGPKMPWMERGNILEADAVAYYEFERDVDTKRIGFITNDAGTAGASPDRLVTTKRLLETKCPSPQVHIGYLMYRDVDDEYRCQLQGQLHIAEAEIVDICAFHPDMPGVIVEVPRDEPYIKLLSDALNLFIGDLLREREEMIARFGPLPDLSRDESDGFGISDADVDAILNAKRKDDLDPVEQQRRHWRNRMRSAPTVQELPDPMEYSDGDILRFRGRVMTPNAEKTAWVPCVWADEIIAEQMAAI